MADADHGYFRYLPQIKTPLPGEGHRVEPFLLRDLAVDRTNQVWCSDNQPKLPTGEGR
jgi:putative transposase